MKGLQVGDRVYLTGVIVEADHTGIPYKVRSDNGGEQWLRKEMVSLAPPTYAALHNVDDLLAALQAFKAANS